MCRVVSRCGTAAGVGAAVVLLWWGAFTLFPGLTHLSPGSGDCSGFAACVGAAVLGVFAEIFLTILLVLFSSLLLCWLGLWLLRVRPAWPVALLGPVGAWAVTAVVPGLVRSLRGDGPWDFLLTVPVGYALAAFVTATEVAGRWRLAVVVTVAVAAVVVPAA